MRENFPLQQQTDRSRFHQPKGAVQQDEERMHQAHGQVRFIILQSDGPLYWIQLTHQRRGGGNGQDNARKRWGSGTSSLIAPTATFGTRCRKRPYYSGVYFSTRATSRDTTRIMSFAHGKTNGTQGNNTLLAGALEKKKHKNSDACEGRGLQGFVFFLTFCA